MHILHCKLIALVIVLFSLQLATQAQNTFVISGKVMDAATKQPLVIRVVFDLAPDRDGVHRDRHAHRDEHDRDHVQNSLCREKQGSTFGTNRML